MSEKQSFTEYYGNYMELVYLVCSGDLLRMNEVFEKDAHEFIFIAEYLYRKRKIENKTKQKK